MCKIPCAFPYMPNIQPVFIFSETAEQRDMKAAYFIHTVHTCMVIACCALHSYFHT